MSRLVTLNRVVDPVGDLLYREETSTEHFMVRIPCDYSDRVDVECDYSDPKIDKVIFTVDKTTEDGYDNWKTASGETTSKKEVVYELWFNHIKGYRATCDDWDTEEYDGYTIYTVYADDAEEYEEESECSEDSSDDCSKDCQKESDLDQYDSYWSIEKKTIDGKTTYGVTVKTDKDNVQKSDLTSDQYKALIDTLHSVNIKKAIKDSDEHQDESFKDYCRKNGIGVDSIWTDFDKIVDAVFRHQETHPFYKDYFLKWGIDA